MDRLSIERYGIAVDQGLIAGRYVIHLQVEWRKRRQVALEATFRQLTSNLASSKSDETLTSRRLIFDDWSLGTVNTRANSPIKGETFLYHHLHRVW